MNHPAAPKVATLVAAVIPLGPNKRCGARRMRHILRLTQGCHRTSTGRVFRDHGRKYAFRTWRALGGQVWRPCKPTSFKNWAAFNSRYRGSCGLFASLESCQVEVRLRSNGFSAPVSRVIESGPPNFSFQVTLFREWAAVDRKTLMVRPVVATLRRGGTKFDRGLRQSGPCYMKNPGRTR